SIGTIRYRDIDRAFEKHPNLGLAFWRAAMLEASILRQRMINLGRRSALDRVAHLLCEHIVRRAAIDGDSLTVPLTHIDLADAARISVVHLDRVFHELRKLGVLPDNDRAIEIADWKRLVDIAKFDARYLNLQAEVLDWDVNIE